MEPEGSLAVHKSGSSLETVCNIL